MTGLLGLRWFPNWHADHEIESGIVRWNLLFSPQDDACARIGRPKFGTPIKGRSLPIAGEEGSTNENEEISQVHLLPLLSLRVVSDRR